MPRNRDRVDLAPIASTTALHNPSPSWVNRYTFEMPGILSYLVRSRQLRTHRWRRPERFHLKVGPHRSFDWADQVQAKANGLVAPEPSCARRPITIPAAACHVGVFLNAGTPNACQAPMRRVLWPRRLRRELLHDSGERGLPFEAALPALRGHSGRKNTFSKRRLPAIR
jgi:hypothetical protein